MMRRTPAPATVVGCAAGADLGREVDWVMAAEGWETEVDWTRARAAAGWERAVERGRSVGAGSARKVD